MLVTLAHCRKESEQTKRLATWLTELGPYPNHRLLVGRDALAEPNLFANSGFGSVEEITITGDAWRHWPESCNNAFRQIAKHIEYGMKEPWLWLEPDAVPLKTGWLDVIEVEYKASGKPFSGDFVHTGEPGFYDHCSGIAVYPGKMSHHAGDALLAHELAWDVTAASQILPQMHRSKLILHRWKYPAFESWEQVEERIFKVKPDAVLFHADKRGSLIPLLRNRLGAQQDEIECLPIPLYRIYTYNENIGGKFADLELLELSKESFNRHGFEMVVLSERDAMPHSLYEKISTDSNLYDSHKITPYLKACYMRWLAVSERAKHDNCDSVVMVDWDVINYGFTPEMLPAATDTITMFHEIAVPGMMIGTRAAFERIIQAFSNYADDPKPTAKGHVHDQNIIELRDDLWTGVKLMAEYPSEGWETAKLVHYPHARLYLPGARGAKIKELRSPLPLPPKSQPESCSTAGFPLVSGVNGDSRESIVRDAVSILRKLCTAPRFTSQVRIALREAGIINMSKKRCVKRRAKA